MNTSEFIGEYGKSLESLRNKCIALEGGDACRDGVKCDISVTGYKDMRDFVKRNSAFFVKDLDCALDGLPEGFENRRFSVRLRVENEATEGFGAWEGEAIYRDCLMIPYSDTREHVFGSEFEVKDGFVVFDRVRILKDEPVFEEKDEEEKKDCGCGCDCKCGKKDDDCKCVSVADRKDVWKELADLLDTFRNACGKGGKDGSFFKSFSYTDDGNGHVKATTDLDGDRKHYDFTYAT